MIFTSLDLEMNQPSGKIIQIGAVIGDIKTGIIIEKMSYIVDSGEKLDPKIITLTGITQEVHDNGMDLQYAYALLESGHISHKSFRNPITWGGGDSLELRQQLGLERDSFIFGRRWIDAKTLFQSYCLSNNMKIQSGLKKSCHRMGVQFEGPAHDALQDALNTFKLFRVILSTMNKSIKGESNEASQEEVVENQDAPTPRLPSSPSESETD